LRQFFPRPRSKLIASESSSREAVRTPGEARRANDGDLGPWWLGTLKAAAQMQDPVLIVD